MHDVLRQRAFARSLEIIGEAVKMLPSEITSVTHIIDWRSLAGLRDKLIHHYFGIDYALVWDVVINELPAIQNQLEDLVRKMEKGSR